MAIHIIMGETILHVTGNVKKSNISFPVQKLWQFEIFTDFTDFRPSTNKRMGKTHIELLSNCMKKFKALNYPLFLFCKSVRLQ